MIMVGKQKTPDQASQAVILREAGWTVSAIADRLAISVSTVQRLLKKHNAVAGAATQALIEKARDELLTTAYSLESVQQAAASLIADELALTQQIRLKLANAIESLDPADPVAFRGLAAASTTLKLTQDVTRRALPIEKLNQALEIDEIPELRIHIMTEDDAAEMRAQQRLEEAERDGDLQGAEDELENLRWMESRRLAQLKQADDDIVCECDDSLITGT
jgi:transcriptional regulator with XRE-family HTH domain